MDGFDWEKITAGVDAVAGSLAETNAAIKHPRGLGVKVYVHADGEGKNDFIDADASVDLLHPTVAPNSIG